MINESISDTVFFNGQFLPGPTIATGFFNKGTTIYEVVRVIDGRCLFLEDHIKRFHYSLQLSGINYEMGDNYLKSTIYKLIEINNITNGNLKFLLNENNKMVLLAAYFIQHRYPKQEDYINGVKTKIISEIRNNPNAKITNDKLRATSNKIIEEEGLYDVLLESTDGYITEGSRTNVFFVLNDKIFTAPAKLVLEGITRKYVFNAIHFSKNHVTEEPVHVSQLNNIEAAFFTGTSPKVLPINQIGDIELDPKHEKIGAVMKEFDRIIEIYLKSR
jgi:branched-chain amino acid aminotransferase